MRHSEIPQARVNRDGPACAIAGEKLGDPGIGGERVFGEQIEQTRKVSLESGVIFVGGALNLPQDQLPDEPGTLMDIERRARPLEFLGLAGEQGFPVEPAGIIAQQSQVGLKPIDPGRLQS